jgi:hypothetical protein
MSHILDCIEYRIIYNDNNNDNRCCEQCVYNAELFRYKQNNPNFPNKTYKLFVLNNLDTNDKKKIKTMGATYDKQLKKWILDTTKSNIESLSYCNKLYMTPNDILTDNKNINDFFKQKISINYNKEGNLYKFKLSQFNLFYIGYGHLKFVNYSQIHKNLLFEEIININDQITMQMILILHDIFNTYMALMDVIPIRDLRYEIINYFI